VVGNSGITESRAKLEPKIEYHFKQVLGHGIYRHRQLVRVQISEWTVS